MFKLLNIEPDNYSSRARKIFQQFAKVTEQSMPREKLLGEIGKYEIIVTRLAHSIDKEMLKQAKNLKIIVTPTTGLDHIDVEYATEKGIVVLSLRGEIEFLRNITATAEHTWGILLALVRRIVHAHQDVLNGNWNRDSFIGWELKGKTLGIIGYGRLGKMIARYGDTFQMRVMAFDPYVDTDTVELVSIQTLLSQSDVISLHIPLNPDTMKFMDREKFSYIKNNAILINTSRGEIIDEQTLLEKLEKGELAGAAVDVLSDEKYNREGLSGWITNSAMIHYARTHSNLLITPHIGGATVDSMNETEVFIAEKLKNYIVGNKLLPLKG